jgi:hypothetical protein
MKKPGALLIVGGILIVVALVAVILSVLSPSGSLGPGGNDAEATITLTGNPCTITSSDKPSETTVGKNKKVTWHVKNNCTSTETVQLGNFRPYNTTSGATCSASTTGGATWPFKAQDENARSVSVTGSGGTGDITLKEAKNETGSDVRYDYDVCIGAAKKDPRLVIEP